ncbi:MAG: hypothetical protein ACE5I4_09435 [Thermoplasmata archaeon]
MGGALQKKLRVQPGLRMLVLNAPEGYMETLGTLPDGTHVETEPTGTYDWGQAFVRDVAELRRLAPQARDSVAYDALLWISYPKKSSTIATDISRDVAWEVMKEFDLRPVFQISIDETWSALRFRPTEQVGK